MANKDYDEKDVKKLLEEVKKLKEENKKLKSRKKYGIVWEEEKEPEKVVLECKEKVPILKDVKDKEILTDKEKPMNLLIEGDNYHALQVLNYTHKGAIDIIYIDPPYNTGYSEEWKYNDKWVDSTDRYRHSKWLNMMNKRLKLAKELIKSNGLIFISVDDNEDSTLKLLCDEIFDESNFFARLTWINRTKPKNMGEARFNIQQNTEYILVYGKKPMTKFPRFFLKELEDKKYPFKDEEGRAYRQELVSQRRNTGRLRRDTMVYPLLGIEPAKGYRWQLSQNAYKELKENNKLKIIKEKPYQIIYKDEEENNSFIPFWSHLLDTGTAEDGKKELSDILGYGHEFETVKPLELIKRILFHYPFSKKGGIVLDFFAGSGTTGHAVLDNQDNKNIKFILCTNDEGNICKEICYPRISKAIKGYKNRKNVKVKGLGGNLKYFKTDFIDVGNVYNISDEHKIELTYKAGEMIAIREDAFEEVEKNKWWQIFKGKNKTVAIYFREDQKRLEKLFEKLKKDKAVIYLFSWGKNELKASEYGYDNIKIKDIPQPIIDVYKEINRL